MTSSCRHRSATVLLAQNDPNHPASEGMATGLRKEFCTLFTSCKAWRYQSPCRMSAQVLWASKNRRGSQRGRNLVCFSLSFLIHILPPPSLFSFFSRWPSSSLKRTPNHSRSLCNTITLLNDTNPSASTPTQPRTRPRLIL